MSDYSLDPMAGCRAYLEAHRHHAPTKVKTALPIVTISREAGAGAVTIGELTAQLLNRDGGEPDVPPWTVFDKNLVERVLEDQHLPTGIRRYLSEDVPSMMTSVVEETLGLHPSTWNLAQQTSTTIFQLANLGNVILVGRGANFVTAKRNPAVHIRLVAPFAQRVAHVAEYYHLTPTEALAYTKRADYGRRRYVKRYFNANVEDPLNYTLMINTGRMEPEAVAHVIAEAVRQCAGI